MSENGAKRKRYIDDDEDARQEDIEDIVAPRVAKKPFVDVTKTLMTNGKRDKAFEISRNAKSKDKAVAAKAAAAAAVADGNKNKKKWVKGKPKQKQKRRRHGDEDEDEDSLEMMNVSDFENDNQDAEDDETRATKDDSDDFMTIPRFQHKEILESTMAKFLADQRIPEEFRDKVKNPDIEQNLAAGKALDLFIFGVEQQNISVPCLEQFTSTIFEKNEYMDRSSVEDMVRAKQIARKNMHRYAVEKHGQIIADVLEERGTNSMSLIRAFCKDKTFGDNFIIEVSDFWPSMYVKIPEALLPAFEADEAREIERFQSLLEAEIEAALAVLSERDEKRALAAGKDKFFSRYAAMKSPHVVKIEKAQKTDIHRYQNGELTSAMKISVATSALIPVVRSILYEDGIDLSSYAMEDVETFDTHLDVVKNPKADDISMLEFEIVTTPRLGLRCSLKAYNQLHKRFYKSAKLAVGFLNEQLEKQKIPFRLIGWNMFKDVEVSCITTPEARFIPASPCAEFSKETLPDKFYTKNPALQRDISNGALVLRIPERVQQRLDSMKWLQSEMELSLTSKVLSSSVEWMKHQPQHAATVKTLPPDIIDHRKVTSVYDNKYLVLRTSRKAKPCLDAIQKRGRTPDLKFKYNCKVFECDVNFCFRFLLDHDLTGCSYLRVAEGSYEYSRKDNSFVIQTTEKNVWRSKDMENEIAEPPIRILSFDTEWKGKYGKFPNPRFDPMGMVGCTTHVLGGGPDKKTWACVVGKTAKSSIMSITDLRYEEETMEKLKDQLPWYKDNWKRISEFSRRSFKSARVSVMQQFNELDKLMMEAIGGCKLYYESSARIKRLVASSVAELRILSNERLASLLEKFHARFLGLKMLELNEQYEIESEKEMLRLFAAFVQVNNPDFVIGWNSNNFDFKCMMRRALVLNVPEFFLLGRFGQCASIRKTVFNSKQGGGKQDRYVPDLPGRIVVDGMVVFREQHKFRSYKLDAVAKEILKMSKMDVDPSRITPMSHGTPEERRRLAEYMERDCMLPLLLFLKTSKIKNAIAMSRVSGIPVSDVFSRGQSIRTKFALLRKARRRNMIIPYFMSRKTRMDPDAEDMELLVCKEDKGDPDAVNKSRNQFAGARVFHPLVGFYDQYITTLDFASLYPSIMIAYNICYSTLVLLEDFDKYDMKDLFIADIGMGEIVGFIKSDIFKGVIPEIEEEYLSNRKKVKTQLEECEETVKNLKVFLKGKAETIEDKLRIQQLEAACGSLNALQLAFKISANSVYGYPTGYDFREMFLSATVTHIGRNKIYEMKQVIEATFCRAQGFPYDAKVIYGDTDSIFILWGDPDVDKCIFYSQAAELILDAFLVPPMHMAFEKMMSRMLLLRRKRYCYYKMNLKTKLPENIIPMGMETVRRDTCQFTKKTLEKLLHILMNEKDDPIKKAEEEAVLQSINLLNGDVDMSDVIFSANLSKPPEEYANPNAAATVALSIAKRDAESAPRAGDRVPFTFVVENKLNGKSKSERKVTQQVEDPDHAMEQDIPVDYALIFEKKFKSNITNLLAPLTVPRGTVLPEDRDEFDESMEVYQTKTAERIFGEVERRRKRKDDASGVKDDECRVVKHAKVSESAPMFAHMKKEARCSGCKGIIEEWRQKTRVCEACSPRSAEILLETIDNLREAEELSASCWAQCQRCIGSLHSKVYCKARSCPIFYRRQKAAKDVRRISAEIEDMRDAIV